MASFILLSIDNSLHWLLDGIEKHRPTTASSTFISSGKIIEEENGNLTYKYTSSEENACEKKRKLRDLFQNHVATFKNQANIGGGYVNIFVLLNIDNEKSNSQEWVFEEINKTAQSNNICLHAVLLSFNQKDCKDTTLRAKSSFLVEFLEKFKQKTDSISYKKILYLNNLDANGALPWLSEQEYEWIMPRMLHDWFMLVSDSDSQTAGNLLNSLGSGIYSIGYSEYSYLPQEDLERFLRTTLKRDMIELVVLEGKYGKHGGDSPIIGLYRERNKRRPRCEEVYLYENIDSHSDSLDYEIDSCLCWFKQKIEEINKGIDDKNNNPLTGLDDKTNSNTDQKDSDISITQHDEHVDFVTRKDIYDYYSSLPLEIKKAAREGKYKKFNEMKKHLEKSLELVQDYETLSKKYNEFVTKRIVNIPKEEDAEPVLEERTGCLASFLWVKTLFNKEQNEDKDDDKGPLPEPSSEDTGLLIREKSLKITEFLKERSDYLELLKKIEDERKLFKKLCEESDKFKLTAFSKLKSCCDLGRMNDYEKQNRDAILEKVQTTWMKYEEIHHVKPTRSTLDDILEKEIEQHVCERMNLDWNRPYGFIESLDDERETQICNWLQKRSAPFINYHDDRSPAPNLTSYFYSSNYSGIIDKLNKKSLNILNATNISAAKSDYIINKICMFQILLVDEELRKHGVKDLKDEKGTLKDNYHDNPIPIDNNPRHTSAPETEFWGDVK